MTPNRDPETKDHPVSCKDEHGRLRVAAATGTGERGVNRAISLIEAGADAIVIDTAHGHSHGVIDTVSELRKGPKLYYHCWKHSHWSRGKDAD